MTNIKLNKRNISQLYSLIIILLTLIISLVYSERIADSVKRGLSLCANVIIPSVFPFMVISDMLYSYLDLTSSKHIGILFKRLFKINPWGIYPFILGILCGFPLGVKCAAELYERGAISKDEAERLIGFCNNTGPAFLVCGVGIGLRENIYEGILLYFVMLISSITVGILFSKNKKVGEITSTDYAKQIFSITESIGNAGINTLTICSYLTFFACVSGILHDTLGDNLLYLFLTSLLEVGSAASAISATHSLPDILSLGLTSFAINFSGLSVHIQAISFLNKTDLSTKRYFFMKISQGIIAFLITIPLYHLVL